MPVADTRCGDVLSANAPLRICDVAADGRLDAAQLGAPDARAALVVPMAYRRQVVGVLVAFDRLDDPAGFRDDDEELLRAFATTAATAVVTAQSVEASRLRAAMASAEAERGRWARELHDETLQGLGGLLVLLAGATQGDDGARLQVAAELAVERVADEIANLRSIIAELRPAALDELGLQPALETLVQRAAGAEGVEMTAEIDLDGGQRLPAEMETAVYRVAQEALTNIAKHSGASHVALQVRRSNGAVLLSVADDGAGFDQTAPAAGYGLAVMRERVTLAGGTIDIDSSGAGTVVRARLPVVQDASSRRPWSSA
jgi:signal transduction histidine kinase